MSELLQSAFLQLTEIDSVARAHKLDKSAKGDEVRKARQEKFDVFKEMVAELTESDLQKGFIFNEENVFVSLIEHSESYDLIMDVFDILSKNKNFKPSKDELNFFLDNPRFRMAPPEVVSNLHRTAKKYLTLTV